MTDEAPDSLFSTDEIAIRNRVARFKARVQESPLDRALQLLVCGCQDLNDAIWQAKSPDELRAARKAIDQIWQYLDTASSIMLTVEEHWGGK
jgi:hypothetical protein